MIDYAVGEINRGSVDTADQVLSKVIEAMDGCTDGMERLQLMSAYVARGTAR